MKLTISFSLRILLGCNRVLFPLPLLCRGTAERIGFEICPEPGIAKATQKPAPGGAERGSIRPRKSRANERRRRASQ